jgi:hypothetical protein
MNKEMGWMNRKDRMDEDEMDGNENKNTTKIADV